SRALAWADGATPPSALPGGTCPTRFVFTLAFQTASRGGIRARAPSAPARIRAASCGSRREGTTAWSPPPFCCLRRRLLGLCADLLSQCQRVVVVAACLELVAG